MADWTVVRHKRGGRTGRGLSAENVTPQNGLHLSNSKASPAAAATAETSGHAGRHSPPPPSSLNEDANEWGREERLLGKMRRAREKVEQSVFFSRFMKQMQDLEVVKNLGRSGTGRAGGSEEERAEDDELGLEYPHERSEEEQAEEDELGLEDAQERSDKEGRERSLRSPIVELVVYGVGSITNSEISRCQLSLALLIKQKLAEKIGDVFVYDPVMSPSDRSVMVELGLSPLENNDEGRRPLQGPTLFYMPHCDVELYESVLQANLKPRSVDKMVILGNSFRTYQHRWSVRPLPHGERPSCLLRVQPSVEEVGVADDFSPTAFNDTSWHLFSNVEF